MYDPTVGRFITQDPIGFDGADANLYRYVRDSPTNLTDPSGESAVSKLGKIIGKSFLKLSEAEVKKAVKAEIKAIWYQTVTRFLTEKGVSKLYNAHHIITQKLFESARLGPFLEKIGVLKGGFENIAVLPTKEALRAAEQVGAAALTGGRHIKDYTKLVEEPLLAIKANYDAGKIGKAAAKEAVEKVQADTLAGLRNGTIKLQRYDNEWTRDALRNGVATMIALAIASGASEAEAEEIAYRNVERLAEQDSYFRQKNVIVRYGTAGYYVKDSNSKLAGWAAFAVDFFNPVEDVIVVTDLAQDLHQLGISKLEEFNQFVMGSLKDIREGLQNIQNPNSLWQMGKRDGPYGPDRFDTPEEKFLRELNTP
jgi:uncharacterized protein RhaS with RHS repeats